MNLHRLPYEVLLRWDFAPGPDGPIARLAGAHRQDRYVREEDGALHDMGPAEAVKPLGLEDQDLLASVMDAATLGAIADRNASQAECEELTRNLRIAEQRIAKLEAALAEAMERAAGSRAS